MELNTARLVMREFEPDDWRIMLEYSSRPEFRRYLLRGQGTEESVRSYVQNAIACSHHPQRTYYGLAMVHKGCGELIGSCMLKDAWPGGPSSIGWDLNPDFWGQGYTTETAQALVNFAFETVEVHSVLADCSAGNIASIRVMEKIGMRRRTPGILFEWLLMLYYLHPQRIVQYSILEHEWKVKAGSDPVPVELSDAPSASQSQM